MEYGLAPQLLGRFDCNIDEMMFRQYLPISPANHRDFIFDSDSLLPCLDIIHTVAQVEPRRFYTDYVYLTVKHLFVSGEFIGNRPGWHSDGFGTDDLNFVWADRAPTDYLVNLDKIGFEFDSLVCDEMYKFIDDTLVPNCDLVNYKDKELIRLDPSVIHRCPVGFSPGMRTFVKVSLSKNKYNLIGNAINHRLNLNWTMLPREEERNHPYKNE